MNTHACLEDLSNEIFFEIFDYFDAYEIFTAFSTLNQRISSILKIIPLRIVILITDYRGQVEYLSSCLTYHEHQVISIHIDDKIRDCLSAINLFFNRHNFINLQSCVFNGIHPSTKLENVLNKLKSSIKLVSFRIYQGDDTGISEKDKYELLQMVLMNQPSSLRLIAFNHNYDYLNVFNYSSMNSNLISLTLSIGGLSSTVSIYSIFPVLRHCHTIRYLTIKIVYLNIHEDENARFRIPSFDQNNLPILQQVIYLNLAVVVRCDKRSIGYILRCMPNLKRFYFTRGIRSANWPFPDELLNGYTWQEMIDRYIPHLLKFEFFMIIKKAYQSLDLDIIVNSFENFTRKYSNWNMIISYLTYPQEMAGEHVILNTFNYRQHNPGTVLNFPIINCERFQIRSTSTKNNYHRFYSIIKDLSLYMTEQQQSTINWSSPLFQQITNLTIEMPMISSSKWHNLFNIANYSAVNDNNDTRKIIPYLTQFVYLHNITQIKFQSASHKSRWIDVQLILQACPNVIDLSISTQLLFLSKIIDNPTLYTIFKRIKKIELVRNIIYVFPISALKIVKYFPSLNHIEVPVFSFDYCVSVIDIFLCHLKDLSYIKINYYQDTLLDDPFSGNYLITKRRQIFPNSVIDENKVIINNNGEFIEIFLS